MEDLRTGVRTLENERSTVKVGKTHGSGLTDLFRGRCRLTVPAEDTVEILNILLYTGAVYGEFEGNVEIWETEKFFGYVAEGDIAEGGVAKGDVAEDGVNGVDKNRKNDKRINAVGGNDRCCKPLRVTRFVTSHRTAARLSLIFEERGIRFGRESLSGLPHVIDRYRSRVGLWLGLVMAMTVMILGNGILWEVQVTGNETMSVEEVREVLAEHGVYPGVKKKSLDIDLIRSDVERESPGIAWMSLNVAGTVAFVQIREERNPPQIKDVDYDGVNLVAVRDGVVTGFVLAQGKAVPQIGATVRTGELLVTGIIDSERLGMRVVRAEGEVYARTTHTVSVTVPLKYEEIVPVKRKIVGISLIFFASEQKLFKNYGNDGGICDTIKSVRYVYSSDKHTVPVGLTFETLIETVKTEKTRTEDEARDLAKLELSRLVAAETAGMTVLSKTLKETVDENGITLTCEIDCNENIAVAVPFVLEENVG